MSRPKVSLVTPSFGQARFLEQTLRSVLDQDYPNIEYIVIDGGSSDGSVELIRRHEHRLAYWVSEPDRGQADAINKGFARASGEYVGWINSDDWLYPDAIRNTVTFLEAHPEVDLVYGDVDTGESEAMPELLRGKVTDIETMLTTFEVPIPQQGSLWRKRVLDRSGGLDSRWQVVLDREFFLRVATRHRIAYRPGRLGFFRLHPDSKSVAQQCRWLDELPQLYEAYFAAPGLPDRLRALRHISLGAMYFQCAWLALKNRQFARAGVFLARALANDPVLFSRRGFRLMVARLWERVRR